MSKVRVTSADEMPFAGYKDFKDCVAKNRDKSDPEAYCASIQEKVEAMEVLIELSQLTVEGNRLSGVQLMPFGKWNHPLGPIEMTPERAARFAAQFKRKVAGQDLPLFYIHSSKENVANPMFGKAAGWFTDVRVDNQLGLVGDIDLTDEGRKAVERKEYRYLSAEFFDKVKLPHHTQPEEDVIMGAALVNRPHLKGMQPILNEETGHQFFFETEVSNPGGGPMDPILRTLAEAAGITLSEDQTELTEEQRKQLEKFLSDTEKARTAADAKITSLETRLSELEGSDNNKQRTLAEAGFEEEARELQELRADRFVNQLSESVTEGHGLSKAGKDAVRAYSIDPSRTNALKVFELLTSGDGLVELEERGSSRREEDTGDTVEGAMKALNEAADKLRKEDAKLSYADAVNRVLDEQPELWNAAQREAGSPWAVKEG